MKNVIITGANSGLGFETAKKIAKDHDYKIILACRNEAKANDAKEKIILESGNTNIETQLLDTSSLASVRDFVKRFESRGEKVDVLLNNAGISNMAASGKTADGFDVVFETNYLGHFLLTQLLLPSMSENARIMNITSDMHNPPGGLEYKPVNEVAYADADEKRRYNYSKLYMIYFTHELDGILKEKSSQICVNCFNPGFMADTNFSQGHGKEREVMVKQTMPERYGTLEVSSDVLASLLTSEEYEGISDQYFDRDNGPARSSDLSYDKDHAKELYEKSLLYCGL